MPRYNEKNIDDLEVNEHYTAEELQMFYMDHPEVVIMSMNSPIFSMIGLNVVGGRTRRYLVTKKYDAFLYSAVGHDTQGLPSFKSSVYIVE